MIFFLIQYFDELGSYFRASMIWIIGEYAERIDNADELLESFLEGFQDENSQVKTYTNVDLRETFVLLDLVIFFCKI